MIFNKFTYPEDFVLENQCIKITENGWKKIKKVKKITGSRFGGVLGVNEFSTPFQTWCDMLGFFKIEMDDFFTNAGQVIEPILKEYAEKKLGCKFKSYDPYKVNFDIFKDNEIYGGLPDGEPEVDGALAYNQFPMLEIKTASVDSFEWTKTKNEMVLVRDPVNNLPIVKTRQNKIEKWIQNKHVKIPLSYQYQLGLYLYLRNINYGIFCVGLLNYEDYLNPEKFDTSKNIIILEEMHIDLNEFQKTIDYANKWYEDHIKKGISPKMTTQDLEWLRYGYPQLC